MKRNYVFAIDVDGVLRDSLLTMVQIYNKEFGTDMEVNDVKVWDTDVDFPLIRERLSKPAWKYFFIDHAQELFGNSRVIPQAKEAIAKLHKHGNIIIATSQTGVANKILTLGWLERNGIEYDSIIFSSDKSIVKADYFLDDHPENFEGASAECILVDAPHNQGYEGERVESLDRFVVKFTHGEYETTDNSITH